jgi:anti-sigma factor RsiW
MHPNEAVLNDYVDDALGAAERAEIDHHLAACQTCRTLVDDLRELARATRTLEPVQPPAMVWRRLEKELARGRSSESRNRRAGVFGFRPALIGLAAAAVLVIATTIGLRLVMSPRNVGPAGAPATSTAPVAGDAASIESELRQAEEHYGNAIKGLEQIANANQSELDPNTAATLQKNLAVIDQAINESRAAVRAQPNSEPAQESLLENFRTKIAVLQDTVALINEMRKGNEAGAARIVSGRKEKGD